MVALSRRIQRPSRLRQLLSRTFDAATIITTILLFQHVILAASQECDNGGAFSSTGSCWDCGLWLAESLVNPGTFGVYSGRDLRTKQPKANDEEEDHPLIVLPIQDVAINLVDYPTSDDGEYEQERAFPLTPFLWNGYHTYSTFDGDRVDAFLPGIGTLARNHPSRANIELHHGGLDRTRIWRSNATAGAFSHVQAVQFKAAASVSHIPAGQELLIDPMVRLGPDRYSELQQQLHMESSSTDDIMPALRTVAWLQQNGFCMDHLEVRTSHTVEHQNGAFVGHPVTKGSRVVAVPVLVVSRSDLTIRNVRSSHNNKRDGREYDQLLLNYAYGHSESSLLLIPVGPVVNLVNHDRHKANVAVRWLSSVSQFHNGTLLTLSPAQVLDAQQQVRGPILMAELYALRDLDPDEELLLDYGPQWQAAFDRHQQEWRHVSEPTPIGGTSSSSTNNGKRSAYEYEMEDVIYTRDEPRQYPPESIQPRCYVDVDEISKSAVDDEGWHDFVPARGDLIDWTHPCDVLHADFDRDGTKSSYRVVVTFDDESDGTTVDYKVKNVPWAAITFVDKPYRGMQYHHRAFRHEIHVPDAMYPAAWRDLALSLPDETCGLYMAESAIPNSGLGMYSARPIAEGDRIFYGDVVVQVEDYDFNRRLRRVYHGTENDPKPRPWLLHSYYWDPSTTLAQNEAEDIQSIVPGLGMLANSHTGLVNAEQRGPNQQDCYLHRAFDVGTGASSCYHDSHFDADKRIGAGEEIFVRYGDAWFVDRMEGVPLQADFVKADILLNRFSALLLRRRSDGRRPNHEVDDEQLLAKDLWDLVRNVTRARDRLASAIPPYEQVETVLTTGTAAHSTPNRIRSQDWLEANGRCLDNLRPSDSTIDQAGKGAFATRSIAKGAVIAPMPVVQILRRDLEVYEATEPFDDNDNPLDKSKVKFLGMQLLLNYCYGCKDSSLLLFPYSPVVNYLNHHPEGANAALRWSTLGVHQSDWLSRSPEDVAAEPHAGLIMELVALRDILPGEEIFINYGSDWSQKWSEFQIDWAPPPNGTSYVSAAMLNRRSEWLQTEQELEKKIADPPSNVYTMCYVGRKRVRVDDHSFGEDEKVFEWSYVKGIYQDTDNLYPCHVVERIVDDHDFDEAVGRSQSVAPVEVLYSVRVSDMEEDDNEEEEVSGDTGYFVSIPREAIQYFDRPYTSDLFLRNAFRHEIQLPDEMVPTEWRDLANQPEN